MKASFIIRITFAFIAMNAIVLAQGPNQFVRQASITDSVALSPPLVESGKNFVILEIGVFPFRPHDSLWWVPVEAFRAGYRQNLEGLLDICAFIEYTEFNFDGHDGITYHDFSHGSRHDYSIYSAIVAAGFIEVALGGYYTVQDEIIHISMLSPPPKVDPVVKKFGVYFHFGVTGAIHIAGPVEIPLGLFLQFSENRNNTSIGIRTGIQVGV